MKLRNRILSLLLAACMLAGLLPVSAMAVGLEQETVTMNPAAEIRTPEIGLEAEAAHPEVSVQGLDEALEANQPEQAEPVTVTMEKVENPGVDLKQNSGASGEAVEAVPYEADETVRVIVVLEDESLLEQGFTTAQIASNGANVVRKAETLAQRQTSVLQSINRIVEEPVEAKYRYSIAVSGLAVEIPYGALEEIRQIPGVKTAFVAPRYDVPEDGAGETTSPDMYTAGSAVGAARTWEELGYTGAGMRIAIIDSGLDDDHPAFAEAPALTEDSLTLEEVSAVLPALNAYEIYAAGTGRELSAERLYRSEKVPFAASTTAMRTWS